MTEAGRGSLRDLAYETIKRRIVEVELAPGQRLVERDLAAELNVSRIPLREALHLLAAEGLVLVVPGKGTLVAPFTPADVRDLFDVREALESLAARLAAQRSDESGVRKLADRLAEAQAATESGDQQRIAAANAAFHAEIIELAGNPLLDALMQPLQARMQWLFRLTAERDPLEQCSEHEELYEMIAAADGPAAAACALTHVAAGREPSLAMAETWTLPDVTPDQIARTRRRKRRTDETPA